MLPNGAKSKMINSTYDQEGDLNWQKSPNPNSISRQYAGFKSPRIVRVSRAFGGKDRHSKVWTVKGLRDRRIRLSVPAAVELYYLQDRLGLRQPSKVIDWLLDATKDDIDKLPPLQMSQGDFNQFHLPLAFAPQDFDSTQLSFSPFLSTPNHDHIIKGNRQEMKGKEPMVEHKWNSYNGTNYEPSLNLALSRFCHQPDPNASLLPSPLGLPSAPQFFSCPIATATPSFCPPNPLPNYFPFLSSSSHAIVSNPHVSMPLNLIDSQETLPFGLNVNSKIS